MFLEANHKNIIKSNENMDNLKKSIYDPIISYGIVHKKNI